LSDLTVEEYRQWLDKNEGLEGFEFWFWRGDSAPFKITGGLGACPQTKLTISVAEIRSISRKCIYTCKSRDSRKSSKKQNQEFTDFVFVKGLNFKIETP
jgi:hypothetical protein